MIHVYWHTDPPAEVVTHVNRWRALTDETVCLWTPEDLPTRLVAAAKASCADVAPEDHVRHVANIARWHILHAQGGLWADADVTVLRWIPARLLRPDRPWCAGFGATPCPFICAGPARHPLWGRALDAALDHPTGTSPTASGGGLLARLGAPALMPGEWFTEHDAAGQWLPSPVRYTRHAWATSMQRHTAHIKGDPPMPSPATPEPSS